MLDTLSGTDRPWSVDQSRSWCTQVSREQAKNFYYGMMLVPPSMRQAQFAIYAWNRIADDLADTEGEAEAKVAALEQFQAETDLCYDIAHDQVRARVPNGPMWPALVEALRAYPIRREYLHAMIAGQLLDQQVTRYQDFEQLYDYCYKVASVVGLTCIDIWGYDGGEQTEQLSEWRGIAFQLTNILRDVQEDARRDRIYLPADYFPDPPTVDQLTRSDDPATLEAMVRLADQAEEYYQRSAALDGHVHRSGVPCMWAMTEIYHTILRQIRADPQRVLSGERVGLGRWRKLWIAARAWMMKGLVR